MDVAFSGFLCFFCLFWFYRKMMNGMGKISLEYLCLLMKCVEEEGNFVQLGIFDSLSHEKFSLYALVLRNFLFLPFVFSAAKLRAEIFF